MAFWKKIFKSKYTGAEIDAAVAKAGNLPATTSADAGKALVVDEEGKIVAEEAGSIKNIDLTSEELQVLFGAILPTFTSLTDKLTSTTATLGASVTHVPEIYSKMNEAFTKLGDQAYLNSGDLIHCSYLSNAGGDKFIQAATEPFSNSTLNVYCMLSLTFILQSTGAIQIIIVAQKINRNT